MSDAPYAGSQERVLFLAGALNVVGLGLAIYSIFVLTSTFIPGFGIMQFAWLGPPWYYYWRKGKTEDARGILVVAGFTFLLNAACWAVIKVRL